MVSELKCGECGERGFYFKEQRRQMGLTTFYMKPSPPVFILEVIVRGTQEEGVSRVFTVSLSSGETRRDSSGPGAHRGSWGPFSLGRHHTGPSPGKMPGKDGMHPGWRCAHAQQPGSGTQGTDSGHGREAEDCCCERLPYRCARSPETRGGGTLAVS